MLKIVILLLSPLSAYLCGPGTGRLSRSAVIHYQISPPIIYTYSENPTQGQISQYYAEYKARRDFVDSLFDVLHENLLPTIGFHVDFYYRAPKVTLVDGCVNSSVGDFIAIGQVVLYECVGSDHQRLFVCNSTVRVEAPQDIFESQWHLLNNQVQRRIQQMHNVIFSGPSTLDTNYLHKVS